VDSRIYYGENKNQSLTSSFYKTSRDLNKAICLVVPELKKALEGGSGYLNLDPEGYCSIKEVVSFLKKEIPYVNSTHVLELFFKDKQKKIVIKGEDLIKYRLVHFIRPPNILFFGTLSHLECRILDSGILSKTKGYIKLYDTKEKAKSFASKFLTPGQDEEVVIINVDSKAASLGGVKFSTFIDGEYIVAQIDKIYISKNKKESEDGQS